MSQTAPSIVYADASHVGQTCPTCGEPIRAHQMIVPDGAGAPHHHRCWERRGEPAALAAPVGVHPHIPAAVPATSQSPEAIEGGSGGKIALILLSFFIPVIGPMVGIVTGFLWLDPGGSPIRRRDGRELLILCSILFVVQLVLLCFQLVETFSLFEGGGLDRAGGLVPVP